MNMKFRNMVFKYGYQQEAGSDGGDGGSGSNPPPENKTFTQADVDKLVAEQVAGLKNKNSELIGEQKKLKDQLKEFDGMDVKAIRAMMQKFADQEEAKLITEGKIDEVLAKRAERMKADHDKTVSALQGEMETLKTRAAKFADRALSAAVREVGAELNIHKSAYDDAMLRAKSSFDIDDDGNAVAKDSVLGKDGKPLTLKEWFVGMKETAPHWFMTASGAGSTSGNASGGKTIARDAFEQLSPSERAQKMKDGFKIV